ncbi:TonB-system energizer ExbB [Leucothrix pacifica]
MDWMVFLTKHLDHMVLGVLGVMSFLMLAFSLERYFYYKRVRLSQFKHVELLQSDLTNNLTIISSVASNAPYIGLLGTVIGILLTFHAMGDGNIDVNKIMVGLAMALKATAAGLLVAIPAILFYNGLMRRVDVLTADWRAMQKEIGHHHEAL